MNLSNTELGIMEQLGMDNTKVDKIAKALNKSKQQIYKVSKKLREKAFLDKTALSQTVITNMLIQLLEQYPNLKTLIQGSGISILTALLEPKKIKEIMEETGLKKSIIYRKLKEALKISAVSKSQGNYIINDLIWHELKLFLKELKIYETLVDKRVPVGSTIYHKTEKEIVFSNRKDLDASRTGFSLYKKCGINILLPTNYYYLPKKKLSKKEILIHSLYIAEKEETIRNLTYVALFYSKFKKNFPEIPSKVIKSIKEILKGKEIKGYPKIEEIKEKADLYDIQV